MENGEISRNKDGDGGNEDNGEKDDCNGCDECKFSELLKNVLRVLISFASSFNFSFFFFFLHVVVLEFLVYAALMLQAAFLC